MNARSSDFCNATIIPQIWGNLIYFYRPLLGIMGHNYTHKISNTAHTSDIPYPGFIEDNFRYVRV